MSTAPLVTLDLFSALVDSRTGGATALARITAGRGWPVSGEELHDAWDARNKASQRDLAEWVPFAEHCRRALAGTYRALTPTGDADALATVDVEALLGSLGDWPLWPDVADGLATLTSRHRVGVLSNVDDDLFARTRVAGLVADDDVLTSERLGAYKPDPLVYRRALERAGGELVHVATSARDVRGALEAGARVVRLRRPGHRLDPAGPTPALEVDDLAGVAAAVEALLR